MAEIKILMPDDWVEQIVNRLRNDPDAEWVEIVRCKDCKHTDEDGVCQSSKGLAIQDDDDFCSHAERRTDETY